MRLMPRLLLNILVSTLLLSGIGGFAATPSPSPPPPTTTPAEAKLGKKIAEQIEKDVKLVDDKAALDRLSAICTVIAPLTQRPGVIYTCKILNLPDINAMTIPGGTIYVTKGLLAAVESDHELAAVIAHEIAHNALLHSERLVRESARANWTEILAATAVIYANNLDKQSDVSPAQILLVSESFKRGVVNGYSIDLETEADMHSIDYLVKSKVYSPVGLYSVMLGFVQMERRHAPVRWTTVDMDHPKSEVRKETIEKRLQALDIPINLWLVYNFHAEVDPPKAGENGYTVRLGTTALITFVAPNDGVSAEQRAADAAGNITRRLMKKAIQASDAQLDVRNGKTMVLLRAVPVLELTQADADAAGCKSPQALGNLVILRIRSALWSETVKRA